MDEFFTTHEAAKILGVSVRRVQALIAAKRLPAQRVGEGRRSVLLIDKKALELVKDRPAGRPATKAAAKPAAEKPPRRRKKGGSA